MRLIALWLVILGVALAVRPCHADEEYESAREQAKQVKAAAGSKGTDDLKRLAEAPNPDPWLVVDALLEAGAPDAAKAFAAAYEGKDAPALRAVASRHLVGSMDQRAALASAEVRLAASSDPDSDPVATGEAVAQMLKDAEGITPGVLRVRWLERRAAAFTQAGRLRDAARDLRAGCEVAAKAGWLRKASALGWVAGDTAVKDHDLRGALAFYVRLAAVQHEAGDADGEVKTLTNAAEVHDLFGETQQSLDRLNEALRLLPAGGDATLGATIHARRGAALAKLGQRVTGRRELEAAIGELRAAGAFLALADAQTDLGTLLRDSGDRYAARKAYESALAGYGEVPPEAPEDLRKTCATGHAAVESNLATLLIRDRKFDAAVDTLKRQRVRFQELEDRANAARALQVVADARVKQANDDPRSADRSKWLDEARTSAISAAAEAAGENDAEGSLYARGSQGDVEDALGHREEATRLFEDVVKESKERGMVALTIEYSVALARVRLRADNVGGALAAVESGLQQIDGAYGDQGSQSRVEAHERHAELFSLGAQAALRLPEAESLSKLFRYVEIGRSSTLLDAIENRETLRARNVPPELERRRLDAARAVVEARRAFDAVGEAMPRRTAARARLVDAQGRYEAAVNAIQADARVAANLLYPQPIPLSEARSMLGPTQALVLYAAVGDDAYAITLLRDAAHLTRLGKLEPTLQACRVSTSRLPDAEIAPAWQAASMLVFEPVRRLLPQAVRTIFASPDGDLGLVPFSALMPEGAPWTFLFVPSASTLRLLMDRPTHAGTGTLALGISKYSASTAPGGPPLRSPALLNLERAEAEATAIGDDLLLGTRATERSFFAAVSRRSAWSAIHFAVHGILDPRNPSLSCLALMPDPENDGDLTAFELLQHDVPADVAVLAACESGGGVAVPGEGLVGLVRALLFAGCPRVVANLWNANDQAAEVFSLAFHQAWRKQASTLTDALEAGRAAVRKDPRWARPYYWAGWCGWGPP